MRSKIIKVFAFSVMGMLLMTCDPAESDFRVGEVQGYRPIYTSSEDATINFITAKPLHAPGKIYVYNNYLLVNEKGAGIHFFNNENPSSPQPLGFLQVKGNADMVLKGNILYVDHIGSLVALNISDVNHITELSRFKSWSQDLPPNDGRYFECVNADKGTVIGWELATLKNPECYR